MVLAFLAVLQEKHVTTRFQCFLQAFSCSFRVGLGECVVMPHFRRIDTYEAYAPSITELDSVTVIDVTDLHLFIDSRGRAIMGLELAAGSGRQEPGGKQQGAQSKKAPCSGALLVWLSGDIRYENQPFP
jgi:hypothetical protein